MNQSELRLGNWVFSCKGGIETIVGMLAIGIEVPFKPIPLTEEWLIKLGFQKKQNQGIRYELEADISIDIVFKISGWFLEIDGIACFEPMKNVHELQNRYYSLTKEELTIKND